MEKKKSSWHIWGEYAINAIISLMRRVILLIPAIGLMRNIGTDAEGYTDQDDME